MTFDLWSLPNFLANFTVLDPPIVVESRNFIENLEWRIVSTSGWIVREKHDGNYYDGAYLIVEVKREPSTLETGVIIPAITISFLSLMYIFIQREDAQREEYLTTVLLTEVMFLVMMTEFVPTARENPSF